MNELGGKAIFEILEDVIHFKQNLSLDSNDEDTAVFNDFFSTDT